MGKKGVTLRDKVIDSFKGVIRSYQLESYKEDRLSRDPNYFQSIGMFFYKGEEAFEFFYRRQDYDRLLYLVDRLYPGQVDKNITHRHLEDTITEWIEQGHNLDNQAQLEQAAASFLDRIERDLRDFVVYVPIEGLEGDYLQGLKLGRCQLHCNTQHSDLAKLLQIHRKRRLKSDDYLSSVEETLAFFQVRVSGHSRRADQEAKKEVQLALNILRLFLGSYYFDVYRRPSVPRRMGLIGTLLEGEHSPIFRVSDNTPIEEQFPGSSVQFGHYEPFKLDTGIVEAMNNIGLAHINRLVCEPTADNKESIRPRLLRCINWFAKGTIADNIADSFLMYAISMESLLTEGRTSKETYAKRIAALVTRGEGDGLYPWYGYLSSKFYNRLEGKSQNERFGVVERKVIELFSRRNDVAHGRALDHEIDPLDLLDFETLVRFSVLSFIDGGWDTFEEFKVWMKQSLSLSNRP